MFNSYHFHISGYGNNQMNCYGDWLTYDEKNGEADLFATITGNGEDGTTIFYKILANEAPIKDDTAIANFTNAPVTIRIQYIADGSNKIFKKTDKMTDFVCVSHQYPKPRLWRPYRTLRAARFA